MPQVHLGRRPAPTESARLRIAKAAAGGTGRLFVGFLRQSFFLNLYLPCLIGLVILAFQFPQVKELFRKKAAHVQEKYLAPTAAGPAVPVPADLQARLDGVEATLQANLAEIRQAVARANLGGGPAAGRDIPLPGRPADVRLLPYPFHSYFSVTSDPDSMSFADFEAIHRQLEDDLQLPLSDQLFCCDYGPPRSPPQSGLNLDFDKNPPVPVDPTRFHRLLVAHSRGWVEGIHGWHIGAAAGRDQAFRLEAAGGRATRDLTFERKEIVNPHDLVHLVFEYRMPVFQSRGGVRVGDRELPVEGTADRTTGMGPAVTWTPAFVRLPADHDGPVTFTLDGPAGAVLEVRNAMVTNFSRARVEAEAKVLADYGLRYLVYTEHCRWRNELSAGMRHDTQGLARPGVLVDNPADGANFYTLPAFEDVGVTFLNAAHQTGGTQVTPITGFVCPHRFNDGVVRYTFPRYFAFPLTAGGEEHLPRDNLSWEPWLGFHVQKLLAHSGRFGDGATIYTHWGLVPEKGRGLSHTTRDALESVRERYYNLSGKTPLWERVWVAPSAEVLLYARAIANVRDHSSYDERTNTVHVRSWYDPVARQTVPDPRSRAFGLANLTFYVNQSATARVLVDGREYTCLKRNPSDQTGRESVTIVDDGHPTVVFDEADPIQRFGDFRSDGADCFFRRTEGFRGNHCLEMVLRDPVGKTELKLPAVSSESTSFFRFACRKTNSKSKVSVRVAFDDGSELLATEDQTGKSPGWVMPADPDGEWRDHVFALTDLQAPRPLARVPRGPVKSITFEVADAKPGDRVFFDTIEFLRHPIHPPTPTGRHLVGGRVDPPTDGVRVVLEDGPGKFETKTHDGGYFYFPHAAETGTVVRVYAVPEDKQPRPPTAGRSIDIRREEVQLSIPLADLRDVRPAAGLEKKYKAESELNSQVGRVYKPRSEFVHSGIGTPQEFENHLQISNLGFLDRDRRPENPDHARRVLFLGNCNLFGHSTPRTFHPNALLEDLLNRRSGYPTEVIALADSAMSFGKHWSYYREIGRPFHADVVCMFLQSSGVEMMEADPDTFSRFYEYEPDHYPCSLFRCGSDGRPCLVEPDPEYFRFVGKNPERRAAREAEKKRGGYYSDGVDWNTIYYRTDWESVPAPAKKAWDHFAKVLRYYHDELAKDGTRLVIVLTPEVQLGMGGLDKDFTDVDGYPCNCRLTGERIGKLCKELGVGFVNTTPAAVKALPDPTMYIWRHDGHPSPYGNRVLAETVGEYLMRTNFGKLDNVRDPQELSEFQRASR
jgi:hypothetical protein